MSVVHVKTAETAQDLEKFRKIQEMLLSAWVPYGIVRIIKENGEIMLGVLRGGGVEKPTGRAVYGYVTLVLEDGSDHHIDIMDIKLAKNAASEEIVQRFTKNGIIKVLTDEEHTRFLASFKG